MKSPCNGCAGSSNSLLSRWQPGLKRALRRRARAATSLSSLRQCLAQIRHRPIRRCRLLPAIRELDVIQPEVEARGVFGELVAELAALSSAAGWSSDKVHRDKLLRCLDDPRLLSIAARDIFEWYVAELLAAVGSPAMRHCWLLPCRFSPRGGSATSCPFCWVGYP